MEYRAATLEERKEFYENEFDPESLADMEFSPQIYAVDIGSKTKINKFPEKKVQLIFLKPGLSFAQLKEKLLHYLPESVYYDRNIYDDAEDFYKKKNFMKFWKESNYKGQQLCFDVDAENIREVSHKNAKEFTSLIKEAAAKAVELADTLRQQQGFSRISFVYSGRGFHVKVHDKGTEFFSFKERTAINDTLEGFPIDRWVSGGYSKLMRLPLSLHGVVSRIPTMLREDELIDFDPENDERCVPGFLKN